MDTRSVYKKKLSADLRVIFPGYNKVFSDLTGVTSLNILKSYSTPESIINAPKDDVLKLLAKSSRKKIWIGAKKTYNKLINAAENATIIGIQSPCFSIKILGIISIIESLNEQIDILLTQIKKMIKGDDLSDNFKQNIKLLMSIPGIGFLTAVTIMVEIGDFNNFTKPKQLVAYFGLDPSVNESGKFKSDKEKKCLSVVLALAVELYMQSL